MSKSYFIDSENVGSDWVVLLETAEPDDEIIVFYTVKSPYMSYKNIIALKQSAREVTFVECCEGVNALDFQLCTELGYRICGNPEQSIIIVSNDTGYDAVVSYWRQRRVFIKRIKSSTLRDHVEKQIADARISSAPTASEQPHADAPAAQNGPASAQADMLDRSVPPEKAAESEAQAFEGVADKPAEPKTRTKVKRQPRARKKVGASSDAKVDETPAQPAEKTPAAASIPAEADEQAREILYIVGKSKLQTLNEALKQTFGEEKGNVYYNAFKSPTAYTEFIAEHAKMTTAEKLNAYCTIIFAVNGGGQEMPEGFVDFALGAWRKKKNLNSFRSALQEKYGKEKTERYYATIKAHMKILDKVR